MSDVIQGDSLEVLRQYPDNHFDSFVTDPPYGIKFMNKKWDYSVPSVEFWAEVFRVLKPGGHILVFCGTRTQHRMAVNIEDAGFEIRDVISWVYGQGFPKSLNISKQLDAQIETGNGGMKSMRKVEQDGDGEPYLLRGRNNGILGEDKIWERKTWEPKSDYAKEWEGWGTALKPACEFITLARKPISEKNVALNIMKWGVGGINIDDCRIELNGEVVPVNILEKWSGFGEEVRPDYEHTENTKGRWPANLILDSEAGEILNSQVDGVSRFFYCPKPSKREKDAGLSELPYKNNMRVNAPRNSEEEKHSTVMKNFHPTVKPISLMEFLVKLITPIKGICCDPFAGSGTTGIACKTVGCEFLGIEKEPEFVEIAKLRIENY